MESNKNVKISVGDYDVYASGSVVGILGQPISFSIESLLYTIEFVTDINQPKLTVKTELISKTHLKIVFINFDDTLGSGNITPIKYGNIGDRELLFQYRIYTLREDAGKMLHYTWLLGKNINKEENNGKENK